VTPLLHLASARFYLRHPWQLALAIVGVSLGVAVYVGVDLANDSAARAFELTADAVRGETTHRVVPAGTDMSEDVYRDLVLDQGFVDAAPVLLGSVSIAGRPGRRVSLLGIDPVQEGSVRAYSAFTPLRGAVDLARLIAEPGTVLVPPALAEEIGVAPGDAIGLVAGGRQTRAVVLGSAPAAGRDIESEPPMLADIATAQEVLGSLGRISYVDLRLTNAEASALQQHLPAGTALVPADQDGGFAALASAFRTNLTAFGLLSLVVGLFLIYGTMSFAVLQRRTTLGVLRAIGVSRHELLVMVLVEAFVIGGLATILGVLVGRGLASGLVDLVLKSIGDLRFSAAVRPAEPSPWIYVQGTVLGLGATLLAAAKPAVEAARSTPTDSLQRNTLERGAIRGARRAAGGAVLILLASGALLAFGPSDLEVGLTGLFGVLASGALLTPAATMVLMSLADRLVGRRLGLAVSLAIRGVNASLSRTAVAAAALTVAVATVNGVGLMIQSFRTSLEDWLAATLTADVYVGFDGSASDAPEDAVREALEGLDGVERLSLTRSVAVPTANGEVTIRAQQPGSRGYGLTLVAGEPDTAFGALDAGTGVVVSERLLSAWNLEVGDTLMVPSDEGVQRLPIAGAFRDFNAGGYTVVMGMERYRRDWHDRGLSGVGIELADGVRPVAVEAAVRERMTPFGAARIRSTTEIERISLEVFDRTFEITEVLRALAAIVAFFGVLSALLAIELDRARELAVLRALGFAPREITSTLLAQTALLGGAAGVIAMPLGIGLAYLLVHVINRRAFGWSMELLVAPEPLVVGLCTAVAAAIIAGAYPAWRASRGPVGVALREE
jgi:putative ABC transport system permease protein